MINPLFSQVETARSKTNLSTFKETPPHSDGSATGAKLVLTSIYGIISDGVVTTGFINVDDINSRLSETTKEILHQPMFNYLSEVPAGFIDTSSFKMPILHYANDGLLNINLFMGDGKTLFYDGEKSSYSEDQIDMALKELYGIIGDLQTEEKITKVNIKEGQGLTLKNKRGLHFVEYVKPLDSKETSANASKNKIDRDVLLSSFEDPSASPEIIPSKPDQLSNEKDSLGKQI